MDDGVPSPAELYRVFNELKTEVSRLRDSLDHRFIPREVYEAHQETRAADKRYLEAEIGRIEAQQKAKEAVWRTWLLCLTGGLLCPIAVFLVVWSLKGTP